MQKLMRPFLSVFTLAGLMFWAGSAAAATRVVVLNFTFTDPMGGQPTQIELERLHKASDRLRSDLKKLGVDVVFPGAAAQQAANKGDNYLFDCPACAADLGKKLDSQWVAVTQFYKPTALFSYLRVHVMNVKTGKQVAELEAEVKGNPERTIPHGVDHLSDEIHTLVTR